MLAVLVDPDKSGENQLDKLVSQPEFGSVDLILVGGSLVTDGHTDLCIKSLRKRTDKDLVIFPGSPSQISPHADSLLLLSLISGRNPDLLIGRHVESAFKLKASELEVISTGYVLLDGGRTTTVSYISNTTPIPQDKKDIAAATALAGELLGNDLIYMDCGSGSIQHADPDLVRAVRQQIQIPLVVGGGIRTYDSAKALFEAGADLIVVGNRLEEDASSLQELVLAKHSVIC